MSDFRVLTPEAFDFVLNNELKRAVRSQNYLTLVLVEPRAEGRERQDAAREVAELVSREIRETDLLSATPDGRLSPATFFYKELAAHGRHPAGDAG